jgi:hypothetical protein
MVKALASGASVKTQPGSEHSSADDHAVWGVAPQFLTEETGVLTPLPRGGIIERPQAPVRLRQTAPRVQPAMLTSESPSGRALVS